MKKFFPLVILAIILGGIFGYFQYNKGQKEAKGATADFAISPKDLLNDFEIDEVSANAKYLDKIIEVEGVIKSVNKTEAGLSVMLDTGNELSVIICEMDLSPTAEKFQTGQNVKIKGFCAGKLMDVVLVRCTLVE